LTLVGSWGSDYVLSGGGVLDSGHDIQIVLKQNKINKINSHISSTTNRRTAAQSFLVSQLYNNLESSHHS